MEKFEAKNGFLQLLFADEDDYYLDSLLRVDLKHYLYYVLRKNGFRSILFLENTRNTLYKSEVTEKLTLFSLDQYSKNKYLNELTNNTEGEIGSFLEKVKYLLEEKSAKNNAEQIAVICRKSGLQYNRFSGRKEKICRPLKRLAEGDEPCAIIVPVEMADLFFSINSNYRMAETQKNNGYRNSIVLITASNRSEDSCKALRNLSMHYQELFPEICEVISANNSDEFYKSLKIRYSDCMHVWNQADKNSVSKMLSRMQIDKEFHGQINHLYQYQILLQAAAKEEQINDESISEIFNDKPGRSLKKIRNELKRSTAVWKKLDALIEKLDRQSINWVNIQNGLDKHPLLYPKSAPLKIFQELENRLRYAVSKGVVWGSKVYSTVNDISRFITTQYIREFDNKDIRLEIEQWIADLDEYMELLKKDSLIIEYSPCMTRLNYIMFLANRKIYNDCSSDIDNAFKAIIKASVSLMDRQKLYYANKEILRSEIDTLAVMMEKYNRIKNDFGEEATIPRSPFYAEDRSEIIALENDIESSNKKISDYEKQNMLIINNTSKIKNAINKAIQSLNLEHTDLSDLEKSLDTLIKMTENFAVASIEETKNINQKVEHLDIIQEQHLAQMNG